MIERTYTIDNIFQSVDRHKLYVMTCSFERTSECVEYLKAYGINVINIGKELAAYINDLDDFSYLEIDVYDHLKTLLEKSKTKLNGKDNDVLAIYNLGILLEPDLKLNPEQLIKEFSKTAALIIIWNHESDNPDRLQWATQQNSIFLDFKEAKIKKLQYAI